MIYTSSSSRYLNGGDANKSAAIFFSAQADRAQRNMAEALIKADRLMPLLLRQAALDVLNDIGKTAGRRNDLIHAMWIFESDWDTGTATIFEPSSPRLSKKRFGEELDKLYADALELGERIGPITTQIMELYDKHRRPLQHILCDKRTPRPIWRQIIPKTLLKASGRRRNQLRRDLICGVRQHRPEPNPPVRTKSRGRPRRRGLRVVRRRLRGKVGFASNFNG